MQCIIGLLHCVYILHVTIKCYGRLVCVSLLVLANFEVTSTVKELVLANFEVTSTVKELLTEGMGPRGRTRSRVAIFSLIQDGVNLPL